MAFKQYDENTISYIYLVQYLEWIGEQTIPKHNVFISFIQTSKYCRECNLSDDCDCTKDVITTRIWVGKLYTDMTLSAILNVITDPKNTIIKIEFASSYPQNYVHDTDDGRCPLHHRLLTYENRSKHL